ncbi:hypothetical protein BBP40_000546 [Aspergillus hancockii]|nr:hypothetical protein BBP40_000546 [Aspergillus hancockii]
MKFYMVVVATLLGLAVGSPAAAPGEVENVDKRTNNCYTLCIIDGGSSNDCLNKCSGH